MTGWWKKGSHRFLPGTLPLSELFLWQYVAGVKPGSSTIKAERKAFREALQAENYDAVIDAQGLVKSAALVTRLAHGVKHGMDWQTAREPLASLFYNRKHHIAKTAARRRTHPRTVCQSLGYSKPQTQGDYAIAQHFLTNLPTDAANMPYFFMQRPVMINTGRKNTGEN